jgi:hypothetical protein
LPIIWEWTINLLISKVGIDSYVPLAPARGLIISVCDRYWLLIDSEMELQHHRNFLVGECLLTDRHSRVQSFLIIRDRDYPRMCSKLSTLLICLVKRWVVFGDEFVSPIFRHSARLSNLFVAISKAIFDVEDLSDWSELCSDDLRKSIISSILNRKEVITIQTNSET